MSREAQIVGELYRHFKNLAASGEAIYGGTSFTKVDLEYPIKTNGTTVRADLVISDSVGHPWLVLETKKLTPTGVSREFDPYSRNVIDQAQGYASRIGAPYFATSNGQVLVLFQTFEKFRSMAERQRLEYDLSQTPPQELPGLLLRQLVDFEKGMGKWLNVDAAFIARMKSLHGAIRDSFTKSFTHELSTNPQFEEEYVSWLRNQGLPPR